MLYQSGHIFLVANRSYERSKSNKSESMPSIILSTVAFECFVNEIIQRLSAEYEWEPVEVIKRSSEWLELLESKRPSTLEKVGALHLIFKDSKINKGEQPYQNLSLLYQLRNELVHRKPEGASNWDPGDKDREYEPHRLVKSLASRGIINLPSPKAPPVWGQFVLNEKTAKWAFNTAVLGVHNMVDMLPEGSFKKITSFLVNEIEEI